MHFLFYVYVENVPTLLVRWTRVNFCHLSIPSLFWLLEQIYLIPGLLYLGQ